jgi:hypothetical protein
MQYTQIVAFNVPAKYKRRNILLLHYKGREYGMKCSVFLVMSNYRRAMVLRLGSVRRISDI